MDKTQITLKNCSAHEMHEAVETAIDTLMQSHYRRATFSERCGRGGRYHCHFTKRGNLIVDRRT